MTTASAANSRAPSIPPNASALSAAVPAGPVRCAETPAGPASVMACTWSMTPGSFSQPSVPRLIGISTCAACGSGCSEDGMGPVIGPLTPSTAANRVAWSAIAARSPWESPPVFS